MAPPGAPPGPNRKNIVAPSVACLGAEDHFSRSVGDLQGPAIEGQVSAGRPLETDMPLERLGSLPDRSSSTEFAPFSYPMLNIKSQSGFREVL